MANPVDLRSDTVTRPTPEMLAAMVSAPVGDDVLGDDPTVSRLEATVAERLGKQAGLFVPSGTMSNCIAIRTHTKPGDEILVDWDAHSVRYEVGGPAALAMVLTRQFRSKLGVPDPHEIADSLQEETLHNPGTALVILENTHNRAGGTVIPLEVVQAVADTAHSAGVPLHIDGARLFNAAVASGHPASRLAEPADTVTVCLSKGLGCPVGSVLCGPADFIQRARRARKMLGGGLRQSGLLAACGLVAMETMVDRLAVDHQRAATLAHAIEAMPGLSVDMASVQTNMVYVQTQRPADEIASELGCRGIRCLPMGAHVLRLVTHHDVDDEQIGRAIAVFAEVTA